MRKWFMLAGTLFFTVSTAGLSQASYAFDDTVKLVMKEAMKGGLCKSVAEGKASAEQKKELLDLFKKLADAKPGKGDEGSWKEKTGTLVKAAQAAVDGKADASDSLKKAANCKACHDVHKGS